MVRFDSILANLKEVTANRTVEDSSDTSEEEREEKAKKSVKEKTSKVGPYGHMLSLHS